MMWNAMPHSTKGETMKPIDAPAEEAVLEMVEGIGPCSMDDLVVQLPQFSWGNIFAAVDKMSRDGRFVVRQLGYSTYLITLSSQPAPPPKKKPRPASRETPT
jgi:hypothetical protein